VTIMSEGRTLLTPEAVATTLDCSLSSVYGWIRDGRLRAVKLGAEGSKRPTYRISHEALQEFLAACAVRAISREGRRRAPPTTVEGMTMDGLEDHLNCATLRLIELLGAQAELLEALRQSGDWVPLFEAAPQAGVTLAEAEGACKYRLVRALVLLPPGAGWLVRKEDVPALRRLHPRSARA
jgi:excisionase family DNA binding protein